MRCNWMAAGRPSTLASCVPLAACFCKPATRTIKNSSKLELTIETNFTLSSSGFSGSCASCKTLFGNSNKLSSRLMYNSGDASVRVCGPVGAIVTGVATPAASAGSSEPNSLRGEAIAVCYFTRFQQRGTPSILVRRAGQTRGVTYQMDWGRARASVRGSCLQGSVAETSVVPTDCGWSATLRLELLDLSQASVV